MQDKIFQRGIDVVRFGKSQSPFGNIDDAVVGRAVACDRQSIIGAVPWPDQKRTVALAGQEYLRLLARAVHQPGALVAEGVDVALLAELAVVLFVFAVSIENLIYPGRTDASLLQPPGKHTGEKTDSDENRTTHSPHVFVSLFPQAVHDRFQESQFALQRPVVGLFFF
jgi:hypothetical protein